MRFLKLSICERLYLPDIDIIKTAIENEKYIMSIHSYQVMVKKKGDD